MNNKLGYIDIRFILRNLGDISIKPLLYLIIVQIFAASNVTASSCVDNRDTYSQYDNRVLSSDMNSLPSQYYVLSYTWAANHCSKASKHSKEAGGKNYLQCGISKNYHYILHGLWPQGAIEKNSAYPRACSGDQPKISRQILAPFLCMTPSVWLLQHEYEFHGTCMPTKELRTPKGYFSTAKKLHDQLILPKQKLKNNTKGFAWWRENNPQLVEGAVQYWNGGKEWQICYDEKFQAMVCPSNLTKLSKRPIAKNTKDRIFTTPNMQSKPILVKPQLPASSICKIKGNISKKSRKKLFFSADHP